MRAKEAEKLIHDNLYIVNQIAASYSKITGIDVHELESYGYEGLICAAKKFKSSHDTKMYLYKYVQSYILSGIIEMQNCCNKNYYHLYLKAKQSIEQEKDVTMEEDLSVVNAILDRLVKDGSISSYNRQNVKQKILLSIPESLNQHKCDLILSEGTSYYPVLYSYCQSVIQSSLDILTEREKNVIVKRYGFYDGIPKVYDEIASSMGITIEGVRTIEKSALNKFRKPSQMRKLKYLLEIFNEYEDLSLDIMQHKK